MNKNTARIGSMIRALGSGGCRVLTGTVVAGSVNDTDGTFSAQLTTVGQQVDGILPACISGAEGLVGFPDDGAYVVLLEGGDTGGLMMLSASRLSKVVVSVGASRVEAKADGVSVQVGGVVVGISEAGVSIGTSGENLLAVLGDLLSALAVLTVPTSSGPSGVPVNASDFVALSARLNAVLTN